MVDKMSLLTLIATALSNLDHSNGASEATGVLTEMDFGGSSNKGLLPGRHEHGEASWPNNIGESTHNRSVPKRRRLNPTDLFRGHSREMRLMDLSDDVLGTIMCEIIGGEVPTVVRPRQMKNLLSLYSFVNTSERTRWVFRTQVCRSLHTLDAVFPLTVEQGAKITPRHTRPENISFLASVAGRALRVIRIPRYRDLCLSNESYERYQLNRMRYMMSTIAQHCSSLIEIAFQDAGSADNGIGELLLRRNPGLKNIQVDVPHSDFLSALAESDCIIEELFLFRVQTTHIDSVKKVLSSKGSNIKRLTIENCPLLDNDCANTTASKARARRKEKSLIEGLEKLTVKNMTSLRSLHLKPERRAAWFKNFTHRFQKLGRADLILGEDESRFFCPAVKKEEEAPKKYFEHLSMDQLTACNTPEAFERFMGCLHEPDTMSITRSSFTYRYGMDRDQALENYVRSALTQKGRGVKTILMAAPIPRKQMFEMFLESISDILNIIEENAGNLDQIVELRVPIQVVTFLSRNIGYEEFLGRLSNLKTLRFVRSVSDADVTVQVAMAIPAFLRGIMNACPALECIYVPYGHCTKIRPKQKPQLLSRAVEDANIALNEYEEANPRVDVWTLRRQLNLWEVPPLPKRSFKV